jgi:hypothetical protein
MKSIKRLSYRSPFGKREISVVLSPESLWLTQLQMSRLFGCPVQEVYRVLKSLFKSGELDVKLSNRSLEIPGRNGDCVGGNFYNLDAVIAAGYRLNPREATHFHIWSTQALRTHLLAADTRIEEHGIIESLKRRISHMLAVA